jgi:mannosyltransferase OCH1-like enzyme
VIPRIVHRIWLGSDEPEWTRALAASWEQPGWEVLTHHAPPFELVNQEIYDRAEEIVPDHVGQLRSDILRYELLARFGGVYVDTDYECLRPIDEVIAGASCFAAWEEQYRWVGNTILGSAPGHPFMRNLIAAIPFSVERKRNGARRPNRLTGPHLVTRIWREDPFQATIFDQRQFYPFGWREIAGHIERPVDPQAQWPMAYGVHWWANQRREQGVPCPA